MKIALIGYGKMGKVVEEIALEKEFSIIARIHSKTDWQSASLQEADICIDFSSPSAVLSNASKIGAYGKSLVIGTTGWDKDLSSLRNIAQTYKMGIVYGPNFSIGMQIFSKLISQAASLFNSFEEFDVFLQETHHREKKDTPSGSAFFLSELLLKHLKQKKELLLDRPEGKIRPDQLQISSIRCGNSFGSHTITFDSPADTITLNHTAKNRKSFAEGALFAAEWIREKKGVYHFSEIL